MSKILANQNIAAINYSGTAKGSCATNNSVFKTLKDRDIAFVASAGNDGASASVGYPACNLHVISVGALNQNLTLAAVTSLQGKIDFFANGIAPDFTAPATSFSAPLVSGAFALMQSAKSTRTSIKDMKFALAYTAPGCIQHRGDCVPIVTIGSAEAAADCIKFGSCINNNPPGFDDIGYDDGGEYGIIYGDNSTSYEFEIDFNDLSGAASLSFLKSELSLNASTAQSVSVLSSRDVVLNFKAKMTDSAFSGNNGIRVLINNQEVESTGYFRGERELTYVINRNAFDDGVNTIELKPLSTTSTRLWGVTDISAELTPVVNLTIGVTDSATYGYLQTPPRYTGLRSSFTLTSVSNDLAFSVDGWDIDTTDETQIFLNGKSYGFLTKGASSSVFSPTDTFIFRKNDLREGINIIEFSQRFPGSTWAGLENEKWAVKNQRLQLALPDLAPEPVNIVDKSIKSNQPFDVLTTIKNAGDGSADATLVRFYISNDPTITSNDTQISTAALATLNEGRSRAFTKSIQSSLVNAGYYIGVCVDSVASESVINNNCSVGVPLKSDPVMAPIIMLLLD